MLINFLEKKKRKRNLVNGLLERKGCLWYLHSRNSLSSGACITASITLSLLNDVSSTTKRPSNIHLYGDRNLLITFIVTSICKFYVIKLVMPLAFS